MADWVLAIDFGTSSTTAALVASGNPVLLEVDGVTRLPSTVLLAEDGSIVVGMAAEAQAPSAPERVDRNPKRSLGRSANLILGGRPVPVTDAVAAIFRHIAQEASRRRGGSSPAAVVLTHPVRWGERRLGALVAAAKAAGLEEPRLVAEPVAAAISYTGSPVALGDYVAVYDLGGGTFDTAILRRTADGFVLAGQPGGSPDLGGEQFDDLVYRQLGRALAEVAPDVWERFEHDDSKLWRRHAAELRSAARGAKEALSSYTQHSVYVPAADVELRITRGELEELIRPGVAASVAELVATIGRADLEPDDLAAVYLCGGSSRVPLVGRIVADALGRLPVTYDDPKAVVVLGAARAAAAGASVLETPPLTAAPGATRTPTPTPAPTPDPDPVPLPDPEPAPPQPGPSRPEPVPVPTVTGRGPDRGRARIEVPSVTVPPSVKRPAPRPSVAVIAGAAVVIAAVIAGVAFAASRGDDGGAAAPPETRAATFSCPPPTAGAATTFPPAKVAKSWDVDGRVTARPYAGGGAVAVATNEGTLTVFDVASGKVRWETDLGASVYSDLAGVGGLVIVADDRGHLRAFDVADKGSDDDPAPRWDADLGQGLGAPRLGGDVVYVGGADGKLFAVDAAQGARLWSVDTDGATYGAPAVRDGTLYAGTTAGTLYVVSIARRSVISTWKAPGPIEAGIAADAASIIVGTREGRVVSLRGDLRERWTYKVPSARPVLGAPAIAGGRVFVGAADCAVRSLDATTGAQQWAHSVRGALDSPILVSGLVYASADDGSLTALAQSGKVAWQAALDDPVTGAAAANTGIYAATDSGRVVGFAGVP